MDREQLRKRILDELQYEATWMADHDNAFAAKVLEEAYFTDVAESLVKLFESLISKEDGKAHK